MFYDKNGVLRSGWTGKEIKRGNIPQTLPKIELRTLELELPLNKPDSRQPQEHRCIDCDNSDENGMCYIGGCNLGNRFVPAVSVR